MKKKKKEVLYQPAQCLSCELIPGSNCECPAIYKFNMEHLDGDQIHCSLQEKFR